MHKFGYPHSCVPGHGHTQQLVIEDHQPDHDLIVRAGECRFRLGLNQGCTWQLCSFPACCEEIYGPMRHCVRHLAAQEVDDIWRTAASWASSLIEERETTEAIMLRALLTAGVEPETIAVELAAATHIEHDEHEQHAVYAQLIDADRRRLRAAMRWSEVSL